MTSSVARRFIAAAAMAAALATAGAANAVGPDEDEAPAFSRLYVRFNFGLAWSTMKSAVDGREIDGSGPIVIGAIGGRVTPSIAVYVETFNQLITGHEAVGIGADQGLGRFDTLGAGVVWTIPVIGANLGQTFSAARLKIPSEKGWNVDTGGFSMETVLGKDWKMTRWWLGIAGHAVYGGSWYYAPRLFGLSASLTY